MKKLPLFGFLAVALLAGAPSAQAELTAGAANADITPPIGTPQFAYTARSRLAGGAPQDIPLQIIADPDSGLYAKTFAASRGIHTRVRARAIVLDSGSERFALVQVDLGGIPYAIVQRVHELIPETEIPLDNIQIAATHTHSSTGPIWPTDSTGYAALGGDAYDARVFEFTAQGIARAIAVANSYRVPAKVGIATAKVDNASRNRNFEPFRLNEDVPKDELAAKEDSIDPLVTIMRVDEVDGRPIGVWSNFAVHQTTFGDENLLFSGDNAAYAERIVETEVRRNARRRGKPARRPEAVVNVWTNGAEGDISPDGGADKTPMEFPTEPKEGEQPPKEESLQYTGSPYASAHMAGQKQARGILRAWRKAGRSMTAELPIDSRIGYIAFDGETSEDEPVGPNGVLGQGGITAEDGTCAPFDNFAGPGQGEKLPILGGPGDSIVPGTQPVSVMRVGPLAITAFPSEITKQMGLRIRNAVKAASDGAFDSVILSGLTNGYSSYTSTPEEYRACHYEGSFTLFGRRQGPLYRDFAVKMAKSLVEGVPFVGDPEPSMKPGVGTGTDNPEPTPNAGTPVEQPVKSVKRYGRVNFSWSGGHPAIDSPRANRLVTTQRFGPKRWNRVATDDGFYDILEREPESDVWETTFQTSECMPVGKYRFLVRGRADKGDGAKDYRIESEPFQLEPIDNLRSHLVVKGRKARVLAIYPDPGKEDTLLALPRRVQSGSATLGVKRRRGKEQKVKARLTTDKLAFEARVPKGAKVRVLRVRDACGNTGA